jgi:hypothetical protein
LIPDDRRGVWGLYGAVDGAVNGAVDGVGDGAGDGTAGISCGATDDARDQEGEAVVDRSEGGAEDARDQPNNDVRMAVEDGSGGGDDPVTDGSSSLTTPVRSLMEGSVSTDEMTPNRLFSCVEDFKKAIR